MTDTVVACPACGFAQATYEPSTLTKVAIVGTRAVVPAGIILAFALVLGWSRTVALILCAAVATLIVTRQVIDMRRIAIRADSTGAVYERAPDVVRLPWAT